MAIWDDAGLSDGGKLSQPVQNSLWHDALHLAAAAGALCISAYDTLSGLKPLEEMKKMIDQGWPKANGTLPLA